MVPTLKDGQFIKFLPLLKNSYSHISFGVIRNFKWNFCAYLISMALYILLEICFDIVLYSIFFSSFFIYSYKFTSADLQVGFSFFSKEIRLKLNFFHTNSVLKFSLPSAVSLRGKISRPGLK